jgi:hypothetical protein
MVGFADHPELRVRSYHGSHQYANLLGGFEWQRLQSSDDRSTLEDDPEKGYTLVMGGHCLRMEDVHIAAVCGLTRGQGDTGVRLLSVIVQVNLT